MKLTKKGMTLFELLAVIVILGIIAAIAFPTVGALINNTKKDTAVANATNFVNSAVSNAQSDYIANSYTGEVYYLVYIGGTYDVTGKVNSTDLPVAIPVTKDGTAPATAYVLDLSEDFKTGTGAVIISINGTTVTKADLFFVNTDPAFTIDLADSTTISREDAK